MPDLTQIRKTVDTVNNPLSSELARAGLYRETLIENRLGRTVYVMSPDGTVDTVPSTSVGVTPAISFRVVSRTVEPLDGYRNRSLSDPRNRSQSVYSVFLTDLLAGPVFVRELGVSVGLVLDTEALTRANPFVHTNFREVITNDYVRGLTKRTPITVNANCYDENISAMHLIVNGEILDFEVSHNRNEPQQLVFIVRKGLDDGADEVRRWTVNGNVFDEEDTRCFSLDINDTQWWLGSDKSKLRAKIKELRTKEEDKDRLIQEQKEKIDNLNRKIELMQSRKSNLEEELGQTNEKAHKTHEEIVLGMQQEIQAMKLNSEQMSLSRTSSDIAVANAKAKADIEVAAAKVSAAQASRTTESISATASIVKSAAIIAPVVAAGAIWAAKSSSSSIVPAVTASVPALTTAVKAGTSLATSSSLVPGILSAIGLCASPALAAIAPIGIAGAAAVAACSTAFGNVASAVWNTASSVVSKVADGVKTVGSAIVNGVKTVGSAIVSGVKAVGRCIGSAVSSVCSGVTSFISDCWHGLCSLFD